MLSQLFIPPKVASADAQSDRAWLELAMWTAGMGSFEWNLKTDKLLISERSADIFGSAAGTLSARGGEQMFSPVHRDDVEEVRRVVKQALAGGEAYRIEHRWIRPVDGAEIWVLSAGFPVGGVRGAPERLIGVIQDITARKLAEAQRETLVAELDHRVKNVLATVEALANQSARRAPTTAEFLKVFSGRLKAMASAHTLLTTTRWRGAHVQHIVAAELGGLASDQARWTGPDLVLTPRATNGLALALHELATNALKYGALSTESGRIQVRWWREENGGMALEWRESGGPPVHAPARKGFGAALLEMVAGRELGGGLVIDYLTTGVLATLRSDVGAIVRPMGRRDVETGALKEDEGVSTGVGAPFGPARIDGLKILIVEDSLLLALELEAGLMEAGATVVGHASDIEEAIKLAALPMDTAVLDVNLNGVSIAPVARLLADRGVPFVYATGYSSDQNLPEGLMAPAIRKPYDLAQVAAALAGVVHAERDG